MNKGNLMNLIRSLLIILALSPMAVADWSTDITLVKDMVVVDKAFIPALLIIRKGDVSQARPALDDLADSWAAFQTKWKNTVNQEWQSGFKRIDQLVTESSRLASTQQDLKRAHSILNEIRRIFAGLREKEGIEYFVDFVSSAENALDVVVQTVGQDKPKPITSSELDIIEKHLLLAQQHWNKVANTRIDKRVYRIDIYYMGDLSLTQSDGVLFLGELTRDVRKLDRAALFEKVGQVVKTVEHYLEILGSTPGH